MIINKTFFIHLFLAAMITVITPRSLVALNVIEEGKISAEDGHTDGDFNDVVFTWSGQVTYSGNTITQFQANIKGSLWC